MKALEQLNFSHKYTELPDHFYSYQAISQLKAPKTVSFNDALANLLKLDSQQGKREDLADFFNGIKHFPGAQTIATVYAGHQFGHYVPQLGDGRALLLGEIESKNGTPWEIQLKGAGPTPYSRQGDGRAVLRSTIREYLCSEAMHGLGIPTTRALCLFDSETPVIRENMERGALLVRTAQTHLRFGNFEYFYHHNQLEDLRLLADFVIEHYYPELKDADNPYLSLLESVILRTAKLIAQWQAVGFSHGVMNTDNMSILGLTLDYGPFGFLDNYQPDFICNHSDSYGRYAFNQQPAIAEWNCVALAQALIPFMSIDEARSKLSEFASKYDKHYLELMARKLGINNRDNKQFVELVNSLLTLLEKNQIDYTLFFRKLCYFQTENDVVQKTLRDDFIDRESFDQWVKNYHDILLAENSNKIQRRINMLSCNPKFILRNYLAQQAITDAENFNYSTVNQLLKVLQKPFEEHDDFSRFANLPPEWADQIVVSCSS